MDWMSALLVAVVAGLAYDEDERNGLKGKVGSIADAESDDENFGRMDVGEGPDEEHTEMEEKAAYRDSEKVLDKGTGVFIETLDNAIMHQTGDNGKVKGHQRQYGLEDVLSKPKGAETDQYEHKGEGDEGDGVLFHTIGLL